MRTGDSPLVSVIIPAYMAADYLEQTMQSVLNQMYGNLELIVVDDGSPDSSGFIAEAMARKHDRITVLRQSNRGVAAARNLGIAHSKGSLIAPLDADDIWHATKIEKQVQRMQSATPQTGLVYCWSFIIDQNGRTVDLCHGSSEQGDVFLKMVLSNFIGNSSSPLIRRSAFITAGLYNTRFHAENAQGCEDWDLYLRIAEQHTFAVVPEYLTGYRVTHQNMSANHRCMERSYALIRDIVLHRHPSLPKKLLRWSQSKMFYFLLGKSSAQGDWKASLFWLCKSVRLDLLRLISSDFYKTLIACIIRIKFPVLSRFPDSANPPNKTVSPSSRAMLHVFMSFLKRLRDPPSPSYRSASIPSADKDFLPAPVSWYDQICRYRFERLRSVYSPGLGISSKSKLGFPVESKTIPKETLNAPPVLVKSV